MKPEPRMDRAYFPEGSRLYREYIFYVFAFNAVERIKRTVFIFFIMLHFFPICIVSILRLTKRSNFSVFMHYEECSEMNAMVDRINSEDDVVSAWYFLYIVWPLYIFLVVITSAFSLFFFNFILQALLSALCLNLKFRQDVQLRSPMKMK